MAGELPSASTIEGVRFTAQVVLPNAIQGIFRRRRRAVGVAKRIDTDGQAIGLLAGLQRRYGPGPVWIRVVRDKALLVFSREDLHRVLEGAPAPFAADPEAKRKGMAHFQPDALTISRGELWENRRAFTEAVLDTGKPHHRLAGSFATAIGEEAERLIATLDASGGELDWDRFNRAVRRITRRIILGNSAADDERTSELLAELMDEANSLPGDDGSPKLDQLMARIREYVAVGEEGSLTSLFGEAPSDEDTRTEGQVPHWLFALGDTLAINALRALALIATHPSQRGEVVAELAAADLSSAEGIASLGYLEACLHEAMRIWPTTPMLSRETVGAIRWNGEVIPAGTQVFIVNTFNHRDPERHKFADEFTPEQWTDGDANEDWSFNHFSHGPQGCPGSGMALFVGKGLLAALLGARRIRLIEPDLDPAKPLPYMLDYFNLRFAVE